MDGLASLLFPQAPSYAEGLLGAEEAQRLQSQAQRSGLLNFGLGLLAAGAPSAVRTGTGAGLVQGLMAGQEAYQRTYQQRLQEMEMMRKLQEQQRAQQMQQAVQQLGPQALAGNQDALSQLAQFLGPDQLAKFTTAAKTAQEMRTPAKPELREVGGALYEIVPGQAPKLVINARNQFTGEFANAAISQFGTANINELTAEQRAQVPQLVENLSKARATQINLPAEREKKLFSEIDLQRVKDFSTAASNAREFSGVANTVNELLKGAGGGNVVRLSTAAQQALGISSETVSQNELAQALATRAAVAIRAPGSGATSDIEFKAFINAVPSLQTSPEGRQLMADFARAAASRNAKLADYARKLAREDKYSEEAMAAYDESLGPIVDPEIMAKLRGSVDSGRPQTPAAQTRDFRTR